MQPAAFDAAGVHPGDVKTSMFETIRDRVNEPDSIAKANYSSWVDWLNTTGGDSPQKAVDLVLRVVTDDDFTPNGEFLWINEPLQTPIPSWENKG